MLLESYIKLILLSESNSFKETKKLFENWNSYLLKETTAARVIDMIDDLEQFNSKIIIEEPKKDSIIIRYKNYVNI